MNKQDKIKKVMREFKKVNLNPNGEIGNVDDNPNLYKIGDDISH